MKKILGLISFCFLTLMGLAQWNANTAINTEASRLQSADIQSVATSSGGTFIAYYQLNSTTGNYDMRAQLLDAQGNKMLGSDGVLVSDQTSGSATFVFNVAIDASNNLIIGCTDQRSGNNTAVAFKVSPAGINLWGNTGISFGGGIAPSVGVLSTGEVIVAWGDNSNVYHFQKIDNAGNPVWAPAKILSPSVAGRVLSRGQIVAQSDGSFSIVYQERLGGGNPISSNLWQQRFNNAGTALWTSATQLSNYVTASTRYYSVLAVADTTYVGYYANPSLQNRFDAFFQRVNPDGSLPYGINGTDFSTDASGYEMSCYLAYGAGNTIWASCNYSDVNQNQYGIAVQRFNTSTGARLLGDFGKIVFPVSSSAHHDLGLSVCDNEALLLYTRSDNTISACRLNSTGDFVWTPSSTILASTTAAKNRYCFTRVINNQAVAVWQENKAIEDRPYAQNIRCDGSTGPGFAVGINDVTINNDQLKIYAVNAEQIRFDASGNFNGALNISCYSADGKLLTTAKWKNPSADHIYNLQLPMVMRNRIVFVRVAGTKFNRQSTLLVQ